jgi:hypothetical protein
MPPELFWGDIAMDKLELPGVSPVNVQAELMSARRTAGDGDLGPWWSEVEGAEQWRSGPVDKLPDGRITIRNAGIIRLRFRDQGGRRPFVTMYGASATSPVQCQMWFSHQGGPVGKDVPLTYEPANGRHWGIGPVSDGTLGGKEIFTQIALFVSAPEGVPWTFEQAMFGFFEAA